MKGGTLIVDGSVGYLAGFMTHDGDLIVCGDAGEALGDSCGPGSIYVAGTIRGLGADAQVREPTTTSMARVHGLLRAQGIDGEFPFKRVIAGAEALVLRQARPGGVAEDMSDENGHHGGYDQRPLARLDGRDDPRHPRQGRARPLPDPRLLDLPAASRRSTTSSSCRP